MHHTISALAVSIMLLSLPACTGGGGSSTSEESAHGKSSGDSWSDGRPEKKPDPRGEGFKAKVIYSSADAINAPAYDSATYVNRPVSLLYSYLQDVVPTDIDDCGAAPWFDNRNCYTLAIKNMSDDYFGIDSIALPDNRFEANLRCSWLIPSVFTFIDLVCDTVYSHPDYRLVVYYSDKKYAPQVLHVNLHPDFNRLRAEKLNGGDSH